MQLSIKGQHIDIGENLQEHVEDKLENLKDKYFNRVTDASVTFAREGSHLFRSNIVFHVGNNVKVQATSTNADIYGAFDDAATRVATQLRRYKKRFRDHHERIEKTPETAFLKARDYLLKTDTAETEEPAKPEQDHVIVAESTTDIQLMSVSEAVMRMDLADQDFMLFKNVQTEALNVVYRREDGNIGWIDPSMPQAATQAA